MQSLYGILRRVWKRTMRGETDRRRPAEKVGPGDVKENTSDDLTVIRGIGIASQNRLYAAGIKSYPRLAHASVEDVREVLGKFGRGAKIENWIAQALKLVHRLIQSVHKDMKSANVFKLLESVRVNHSSVSVH